MCFEVGDVLAVGDVACVVGFVDVGLRTKPIMTTGEVVSEVVECCGGDRDAGNI